MDDDPGPARAGRGQDLLQQQGDGFDVVGGLARQADHEVHLDLLPAVLPGDVQGLEDLGVGDILVDGPAQPLAAGLGNDGDAGLAEHGQGGEQSFAQRRRAQRGDGKGDVGLDGGRDAAQQLRQVRVVAGAQRCQGEDLVAGGGQGAADEIQRRRRGARRGRGRSRTWPGRSGSSAGSRGRSRRSGG